MGTLSTRNVRLAFCVLGLLVGGAILWKLEIWTYATSLVPNFWHAHARVPVDYFQEWGAVRNYFDGVPIYTPLEDTYRRRFDDLGFDPPPVETDLPGMNPYNAHPPSSVLLFLPLAAPGITYVDSFRLWNALALLAIGASIWLIAWQLRIQLAAWVWAGLIAVLVVSYPFGNQLHHGQLNSVLLLLITAMWAAQRNGRFVVAGLLLGAVTVIKLFPGFLFLYFLARRQWTVVITGFVSTVGLTALTVLIFGLQAYQDYVEIVVPSLEHVQSWTYNASLWGFWKKLFDSPSLGYLPVEPLAQAPLLARLGIAVSYTFLITAFVWLVARTLSRAGADLAFGLAVIVMLLVSPITWQHAYLLLILPLAVLWQQLPSKSWHRWLSYACVAILWFHPREWLFRIHGLPEAWEMPAGVWLFLSVSVQLYALIMLMILCAIELWHARTLADPVVHQCRNAAV